MAHHLFRLILALVLLSWPAVAQTAGPFSHKTHLAVVSECTDCHTAVRTSTQATDNLLPQAGVCARCHDAVSVKGAPQPTTLRRFNHEQHLAMGNVAPIIAAAIDSGRYLSPHGAEIRPRFNTTNQCVACHHGAPSSGAVSKALYPQMADCLVCHAKIEAPWSCETCHAPGPYLRPATHTNDFIDLHSSGRANLDKPSCAVCHGRDFHCAGCH